MAFDFGNANEQQKIAISTTEGPLLIIAGPGTGKTYTLVKRIVYLIKVKQDAKSQTVFNVWGGQVNIANDTSSVNAVMNGGVADNKNDVDSHADVRNVLINVLDWLDQLLKYAESCSTQLENSLNKENPKIRWEKYREFSDSLSEMKREYLTSRNKQIVLLESIGSSIDINGYFHSEISEFIDNLEKLGEDFIHQPNTEDSVDINNGIYKRFEDAITAQQRMIGEELKFTKAVGDL